MNSVTSVNNKEEVLKVNAIDQAIRNLRRTIQPPWTLQKSTLRLFSGVLEYPKASDHARLAFLNDQKDQNFGSHPRYVFTSIKDFYEDPTYRNTIAEIWNGGTRYLGVRNKTDDSLSSVQLDSAESIATYASSGDAGTPVLDTVIFKTGSSSVRIPITSSTGTASVENTFTANNDSDYKRKYHFRWVYLDSAPTSITLYLGADSSNYLSSTVTTQFSGASFVTDDWNLLALDMNTTWTGTENTSFDWQKITFTGASTGTYYLDSSYMKGWTLEDYWYYSSYNKETSAGVGADYFSPDNATYDGTDLLIGDDIWADVIVYEAQTYLLSDEKEQALKADQWGFRNTALEDLFNTYPDLSPKQTTNTYRFGGDYQSEMIEPFTYGN
jgi:hypothetical protein